MQVVLPFVSVTVALTYASNAVRLITSRLVGYEVPGAKGTMWDPLVPEVLVLLREQLTERLVTSTAARCDHRSNWRTQLGLHVKHALIVATTSILLAATSPVARGADVHVPADMPTIQAAIDSATSGDTIVVAAGTYDESLNFAGKSLSLVASAGPSATTLRSAVATVITARDVTSLTIRGFTITGATTDVAVGGIDATGSAGLVERNVIGPTFGCRAAAIAAAGAITIRNNVIWGAGLGQSCAVDDRPTPVLLQGGAVFVDNLVTNNLAVDGGGLTVVGNAQVERNIIVNNTASAAGGGIAVRGGTPDLEMLLQNNLVEANTAESGGGIHVDSADGLTIRANTLVFNGAVSGSQLAIVAADPALRLPRIISNLFDVAWSSDPMSCSSTNGASTGTFTTNAISVFPTTMSLGSCLTTLTAGNFRSPFVPYRSQQFRDYHLNWWAPMVDRASTTDRPTSDFDGDTRPIDGGRAPAGAQPDVGFDETTALSNRPRTEIISGPGSTMDPDQPATFVFRSSTSGATFQCNVDMAGWQACSSPFTMTSRGVRTHSFQVRARTSAGSDPTPPMRLIAGVQGWRSPCTRFGTNGNDTIFGTMAVDWLCGQGGDDVLHVRVDTDTLDGGSGNDVLVADGASNAVTLIGGDGWWDIADFSRTTQPASIWLVDPFEPDYWIGAQPANIHWTVEGIWAGSDSDTLYGNAADNLLFGNWGADTINGGPGFDYADYRSAKRPVRVDLTGSRGNDGMSGEHDTVAADVEGILGGDVGDVLLGSNAMNDLDGDDGNDLLAPGRGADVVFGRSGADIAVVNDGSRDAVYCGAGRDVAVINRGDFTSSCEVRVTAPNPFVSSPVHFATVANPHGSANRGVRAAVVCATNRVSKCTIKTVAIAKPVIGGRTVAIPIGTVTSVVPRSHGAAAIQIALPAAVRGLFASRSTVPVTLRVSLKTGSTFVLRKTVSFKLPKIATAAYEVQSVDPPRDVPSLRSGYLEINDR